MTETIPEDATPKMVAAALAVDWSYEDEEGTVHNLWHAMRAALMADRAARSDVPAPVAEPVAWRSMDEAPDNGLIIGLMHNGRKGDSWIVDLWISEHKGEKRYYHGPGLAAGNYIRQNPIAWLPYPTQPSYLATFLPSVDPSSFEASTLEEEIDDATERIRQLEADKRELVEGLKFYAQKSNWDSGPIVLASATQPAGAYSRKTSLLEADMGAAAAALIEKHGGKDG